jgi:hypothetical protein
MPQLRAPQTIRSSATGSSLFNISISFVPPESRFASCESSQ